MNKERNYHVQCPHCKNYVTINEVIPDGTTISFFADFKLEKGRFEKSRCFASITNQIKKKKEVKEKQKIDFKEKEDVEELF